MRHTHPARFAACRGFTLIESIIVMVALGFAAAGVISLQANIFSGRTENNNLQVGTQLMQECAEKLLALGRANYADPLLVAGSTASCSTVSFGAYTAPAITITDGNSGTAGLAACPYTTTTDPTATKCKLIKVTQGNLTNGITLMLVKH